MQRVQQKQQVKEQQSYISFFVVYLTIPSSSSPNMTILFNARLYGRFIEIQSNLWRKKLYRTSQGSNFLACSLSNKDNVRAPIQFRSERQPQHLIKRSFFLKNWPIHFHINGIPVIGLVKWNQLNFCSIAISCPLYSAGRSDSGSEAYSSCCHRSGAWSHLD